MTEICLGQDPPLPLAQRQTGCRVHSPESLEDDDPPPESLRNRILGALPQQELTRLLPALERITLDSNHVLFQAGELALYSYFPQDVLISLLAIQEDGRTAEVSLTGAEGVLGIPEILGAGTYRYTAVVEIAGSCLRMGIEAFKAEFRRGGALQVRSLNYLRYLFIQAFQTVACNRLHRVRQRLARRLLMIQDRVQKPVFSMTHESLSSILGTPRSEVSFAAEALRHFGIIAYAHGKVTILDRAKLESQACECYGVIHREFLSLS